MAEVSDVTQPGKYTCGTLNYTLRGLAMVFFWLMLGGLTLSLCTQIPNIMLPVKLGMLEGVSDFQKSIILVTIGGVLNMTVCPYIGFKSDRYRSRWGRRIPFILSSLPFICISLLLFGFGDVIGSWTGRLFGGISGIAPITYTVLVIALIMFLFQFFNMYVNSVFWYIFNDIIPPQFFGRIMGAVNMAMVTGVAIFNFFFFKYAKEYYTEIFVLAAIVYAIGMLLMCLNVKEGEYPPVTGEVCRKQRGERWRDFCLFFRETCSNRFYIMRYGLTTLIALAWAAGTFGLYLNQEMGLNDDQIGKLNGMAGMIGMIAGFLITVVASVLIDRWHPMRIYIYNILFALVAMFVNWKWLFSTLPPEGYILVTILGTVAGTFLGTLAGIAGLPMEMLTFPKSRFGQFCSAQALIRSSATTLVGLGVGAFFDLIRYLIPISPTYAYRFVNIWPVALFVPAAILAYFTYREWGRLGGYRNYAAPAPWAEDGKEPLPQPETLPPSVRGLRCALLLFDVVLWLTLLGAFGMMGWATAEGQPELGRQYLYYGVPAALAVIAFWIWVRRGIVRDIKRCLAGEQPRNGIPHHGILILVALQHVMLVVLCFYQTWLLPNFNGVLFLLAEISSNLLMVLVIYAICRMERGIVTEVTPPQQA